jgi:uncharacterized protein (TIGR02231 family)
MSEENTFTNVDAHSAIKEVTVYENRAQVHRHAVVELSAGESRIVFADLPSSADRESLQVSFGGEASGVALRGVTFDTITKPNDQYEPWLQEREQDRKQLEALAKEKQALVDKLDLNRKELSLYSDSFERSVGDASGVCGAVFEVRTWDTVVQRYLETTEQGLATQKNIEDQIHQLEEKQKLINARRSHAVAKDVLCCVAVVIISSKSPHLKFPLVLSYMVPGASWKAEYEVRVLSESKEIRVGYNAIISQTTEEPWCDVDVTLSTARPSLSGRQPELAPWRIGFIQECMKSPGESSKKKRSAGLSSRSRDLESVECRREEEPLDDDPECPFAPPRVQSADVSEQATSVSFHVPHPMTIADNGDSSRAPLSDVLLVNVEFKYVAVPAMVENAFAAAEVTNTSSLVFVAGEALIFLDGQYVAKSAFSRTGPGEKIRLNVGRDEGISVKRQLIHQKRAEAGGLLSSKKDCVEFKYRNTFRNNKPYAAHLTWQERIPVSDTTDIVVDLQLPNPSKFNDEQKNLLETDGFIDVPIVLQPGEQVELELQFQVLSPHRRKVFGV